MECVRRSCRGLWNPSQFRWSQAAAEVAIAIGPNAAPKFHAALPVNEVWRRAVGQHVRGKSM